MTRWLVTRTNKEFVSYLSRASSVSPALAQVLINRGLKTPEAVRDFISGGALKEPFALAGVSSAVDAIKSAKMSGTKVLVHGDYDVDGVSATAIMVKALRLYDLDTGYFIPDRFRHGYGFGPHGVEVARETGAGLIITVDCGITSFEAVELAKKHGIGVIITDHHEAARPPAISGNTSGAVPSALSVINPRVSDPDGCNLSGAGVALKVAMGLGFPPEEFVDLAALGTFADVVPLLEENRVILKNGLALIKEGRRAGIKALKSVSGLDGRDIKAERLSFTLLPRMNAAGRVSSAGDVVELLLTESEEVASGIASGLDRMNSERQKIEETVYKSAMAGLEAKGIRPAIVLSGEGWHEGVIGIVASKMADAFLRPTFILSLKDGMAKGSARSIPGFDLHAALAACREHLISFGGHKQAAGLRLRAEDIEAFEEQIISVVQSHVSEFVPSLRVDADISLPEVGFGLVKELDALEPFGEGNPLPLFGSRGLEMVDPRIVGNGHLKTRLRAGGRSFDAIGFEMGGLLETLGDTVDAVYAVTVNEWEGGKTLQLNLKGLRAPSQ